MFTFLAKLPHSSMCKTNLSESDFPDKPETKKERQLSLPLFIINIVYDLLDSLVATSDEIFFTKPCSTAPGPTSTNVSAPAAIMFWIVCVQRTGAVN